MRPIRFRAWDVINKRMIYWDLDTELYPESFWSLNSNKIIMQFTGLNDKNGKEIYEGDICRCIHSEQNGKNPFEKIEQVYTRPGGFSLFGKPMQDFSYESNNRLTAFNWKTDRSINIPEFYYKIYDIEVIGNIWEHPTLLAEKVGENEAK